MKPIETANLILDALKERKAFDIVRINVEEKTSVTDYFIVASARSSTQVKSLAEHVEAQVEKQGVRALRKEGISDSFSSRIDYCAIINF